MFLSGSFAVTLQCSHQCDHSVPGLEILKEPRDVPKMFQIGTFAVSWECSCSVPLLGTFCEILCTHYAHSRKASKLGTCERCLQCPKNFPKFSQKRYTAG